MTISVEPARREDLAALVELLYAVDRYYGDATDETPEHRAAQVDRLIFGDQAAAYVLLAKTTDGAARRARRRPDPRTPHRAHPATIGLPIGDHDTQAGLQAGPGAGLGPAWGRPGGVLGVSS